MLTVMNEMSVASIVATAGRNSLFSVLWLRCLSVQAFMPQWDSFCSPNYRSVRRFVALSWHGSGLDVGTLVTLKRSMIQYGR